MSLKEQVYSVLLVSSAQNLNDALGEMLTASVFSPVHTVTHLNAAKRAFSERAYDVVIINSPLPDDPGIRFSIDVCGGSETVALLLIRADFYDETTDRVAEHGVFTLSKPISKQMMLTALQWMISARERLRKTEKKTLTLEEKMAEIRIVNRAKWILIEQKGMDEPTAHRYIEKRAMDRCVTRRVIAEEILNEN